MGQDRRQEVAFVGEAMIELASVGDGLLRPGVAGDSYNAAVYLARLVRPQGGHVAFVTALGDDPQSDRILAALVAEGIDTGLIERIPGAAPGLYMIELDAQGERSFSYWRSASAARRLFSLPGGLRPEALSRFGMVCLSAISLAILAPSARAALRDWARGYRAAGGRIAFDSNYRPRLWEDAATARAEIGAFWAVTDIALPSLDDEQALFGDADAAAVAARLAAAGVRYGALKCGAAGPLALDGSLRRLPVAPVADVVDTTAAGDSFDAGFLAAVLAGADIMAAMAAGHALATRVIRHPGAILPAGT